MGQRSNEEVVNAYVRAYTDNDEPSMRALRHPDWSVDYPQSGERIRGHANDRAIADNYPGGVPDLATEQIVGSEDRWVVSPSFTYERIVGSGDTWFLRGKARYPDRSTWYVASIIHLRDGLIHHEITYWAEPFEIARVARRLGRADRSDHLTGRDERPSRSATDGRGRPLRSPPSLPDGSSRP